MRIERLELRAVGPFENDSIEFPQPERPGLWIVHGPNEAGKSSTLRALRYWLFGFPTQVKDNFRYNLKDLRVGGVLIDSAGQRLEFLRRKGQKATLRTLEDRDGFDESLLTRALRGLSEPVFSQQFGIDYDELRRGGRAIIEGNGDLGQILFAATAGLGDLSDIHQSLDEHAAQRFKKGGRNPRINQLLTRLKELKKTVKQHSVKTDDWQRKDRELATAQQHLAQLNSELTDLRKQKNRLERTLQSLSLVGERNRLKSELEKLSGTPRLPETFDADLRETQTNLRNATQAADAAKKEVEQLQQKIEQLEQELQRQSISLDLANHSQRIDELNKESGQIAKAAKDRRKLEGERKTRLQQAHNLLKDLGRDPDLDQAEQLRLTQPQRTRIHALAQ